MDQKDAVLIPVTSGIQKMFATGLELVPFLPILRMFIDRKDSTENTSFLKTATNIGITDREFLLKVLESNNKSFDKLFAFLEALEATHKLIHESGVELPNPGEMMFRSIINEKNIND